MATSVLDLRPRLDGRASGAERADVTRPRARLLSDRGAIEPLEASWRELAVARGNAFASPDWYWTAIEHYGDGAAPAVVALTDPGRGLVGLLPMVRSARWPRIARFGGANLGDLFTPVAESDQLDQVAVAAAPVLAELGCPIVLDNVPRGSGWVEAMRDAAGRRMALTRYRSNTLPRIDLDGLDWSGYLATRSRNFRSQLGRKRRALGRDRGMNLRLTRDPVCLKRDLDVVFDLHEARWSGRGGSGSLTDASRAFHHSFARKALANGWLRLWILELDSTPIAAWYGWRIGATYAYYLSGFDPRHAKRSPGLVLLAHTIEEAIGEGARTYDLLLGEEEYKSRFATSKIAVETVALAPALRPARLVVCIDAALWRAGRRLSPRTRERLRAPYRALTRALPTTLRR
jgi:CelD/BcsL family acetyltransferase involved in cellulose biosynthesis